nr:BREX-6 system phosphatase PglZ [Nannocystis sp.]
MRRPAWEVVRQVATLGQAIAAAGPALAADSLEVAVQRYVHSGASVDQAHRLLEQRWHGVSGALLPGREELRAQVVRTRELWHEWADSWARGFSALCKARGFVPAPALQQRTLFEEVVRPLTAGTGTTVVFLVDALRYEMAEELRRELGDPGATTIELRARLAELPSITAVGMNALAPVSERGKLRPALRDGAIVGLQRGEYRVDNPESRKRAMHERVDKAKCPSMSLDELLADDAAALKHRIAGAKLALVHVDAIDSAGEKGNGLMVFELVLQRLRSACNLLREAGARRFVITADHGFLLLDDAVRQTQAHGRKIDPWRRHVLSPVAADHPGEVRVPLSQLDYEGVDGVQLMMPEGIAVFDIGKRTLSFVHGGGSLQERVIPVLTIVHRSSGAGGDAMAYGIKARAQEGVAGLHSIAAKVHVLAQHALDFGGRRQVELALQVEGEAEVQVDGLQTRGGAVVRAGSIVATVDAEFEVFFKLVGPHESRVRIALVHPMHEVEVASCVLEEFFTVSAVGVRVEPPKAATAPMPAEAPKPTATARAWLEAFTDAGVRELFEHLAAHGVVTEDQAAKMLGGARGVRRFSGAFEEHIKKAPFIVRIETVGGVKRYVREGQER